MLKRLLLAVLVVLPGCATVEAPGAERPGWKPASKSSSESAKRGPSSRECRRGASPETLGTR